MIEPTPKEVLSKARKFIELKDDWFGGDQHNRCDGSNQLCLGFAINRAIRESLSAFDGDIADKAWAHTIEFLGFNTGALIRFNDTHTHTEVLALIDGKLAEEAQM